MRCILGFVLLEKESTLDNYHSHHDDHDQYISISIVTYYNDANVI